MEWFGIGCRARWQRRCKRLHLETDFLANKQAAASRAADLLSRHCADRASGWALATNGGDTEIVFCSGKLVAHAPN
jgi:hypothetical protein